MADLTNKYIYETYKGLIKTIDNEPIDGALKSLSDGEGNPLPIEVSETEIKMTAPTTVPNLFIEGYGEVINQLGYFVGEGGGGGGTGTSGTSGTSGLTGSSGTAGTSGQNGSSGTSGRNGFAGLDGTSGTSGIGSSGTSGVSGNNGASGLNGTSGISGLNGTSGTSGLNGTSGTSGLNGTSGTSGIGVYQNLVPAKVAVVLTANINTIFDQILIPANTVKDATNLEITGRFFLNKNGLSPTTSSTCALYINTTSTIGGTTIQLPIIGSGTTNIGGQYKRDVFVVKADGTDQGSLLFNLTSFAAEGGSTSTEAVLFTQSPINWTLDQYVIITVNSSMTGISITPKGLSIKI